MHASDLQVWNRVKWRLNLRGGADVHVVLDGQRLPARAQLEQDPR